VTVPDQTVTKAQRADVVFGALASPQRRAVIQMLADAEREDPGGCCGAPAEVCACRFSEKLALSAPTISHHMRVLVDAGLVSPRKRGHWVYYRLRREALNEIAAALREWGADE
jgi:DNA-binding transcriptional ArsR family regulator